MTHDHVLIGKLCNICWITNQNAIIKMQFVLVFRQYLDYIMQMMHSIIT